jgi:hypothetical protein
MKGENMRFLTFQGALEEQAEIYREKVEQVHRYRQLFGIAHEFGEMFSTNHGRGRDERAPRASCIMMALGTGTIDALALDLHMGMYDTMAVDIKPIVDGLKEHEGLEYVGERSYIEMGWIGWLFRDKDTKAQLLVRAWFVLAKVCSVEGTGEYEEKKRLVCEDGVTALP